MIEAVLLYNPHAGRVNLSEKRLQILQERFYRRGIRTCAVPTQTGVTARLDLANYQLLIVYGGDGTIREATESAVAAGVPMALLPAGTINLLARELRIPLDPERAADLVMGNRRKIFLGMGNEHYFHQMAGIGLDAFVIQMLPERRKRLFGAASYGMTAMTALWKYPMHRFAVDLDGACYQATFALVANSPGYGGGFRIAPQADLHEEGLDICLFTSRSRHRLLLSLISVLCGKHLNCKDVVYRKTRSLTVSGNPNIPVQMDGELVGFLPISFRSGPALEIVLPRTLTQKRAGSAIAG